MHYLSVRRWDFLLNGTGMSFPEGRYLIILQQKSIIFFPLWVVIKKVIQIMNVQRFNFN